MSTQVKDRNPILKDIVGIAKALKIEPANNERKNKDNVVLVLNINGEEKKFPFEYNKDKDDLRIKYIPMNIPDDVIMEGKVEMV